jgi:RNA polymerase sigma-70 factor (ECF subfamily)
MPHAFEPSSGRRDGSAEPPVVLSQEPEDPSLRLVRLIQQGIGREGHSRQLFELHHRRVASFFKRKGFSAEKIPDLTQDVFLRVFKSIDSFRSDSSFEWWLLEIADNVYKNELRWKSADKRDGIEQSLDAPVGKDDEDSASLGDLLPSDTPSPLSEAEQKQREERVRAAFRDLPPQMLLAVQLRYEKDLKYQEIADLMGISIETVKAHLFQARKRLIAKFGEAGKDKK